MSLFLFSTSIEDCHVLYQDDCGPSKAQHAEVIMQVLLNGTCCKWGEFKLWGKIGLLVSVPALFQTDDLKQNGQEIMY